MSEITRVLSAMEDGDAEAATQLLPLVYEQLRRLAAFKISQERPGHTLQATALVHEAYIRLVGNYEGSWKSRGQFFGAAAEAMRRILVESARYRKRKAHGGDFERLELEMVLLTDKERDDEILAVDEALSRFAIEQPIKAELVKLRYFAGFTTAEAAQSLGISVATAERYWQYARARLALYLRDSEN